MSSQARTTDDAEDRTTVFDQVHSVGTSALRSKASLSAR